MLHISYTEFIIEVARIVNMCCEYVHIGVKMYILSCVVNRYIIVNTVWLQSVESIKLQVSFAEYRLFCRSLLQNRPIV